jgi:hypothetical protein
VDRSRLSTGRWLVVALLAAVAVPHIVLAVRMWDTAVVPAGIDVLVAVAALVVGALVFLRPGGAALLAAAGVGAVGVALYLLPGLVVTLRGERYTTWLDPWAFAALLVDALVVRIAVFTLRRADREAGRGAR